MFAGLILVPIVSIFTKRLSKPFTDSVFSCYNNKITVPVTDSIGSAAEEISEEVQYEDTVTG